MQRSAMNREGELTSQLSSGRQAFAKALQDSSGHPGEFMPGGAGDQQRMQQLSMLGAASGDPAMQHAGQMYMQQQHSQLEMSKLQQQIDYQNRMLGLKGSEQGVTTDPYGNPITYKKHALPGALGASGGQPGGGGPAPSRGLDPALIDKYAEQFAVTGQMPQGVGAGKRKNAIQEAIGKRAMELYPDVNLAENKAGYIADQKSLAKQQQLLDLTKSWEGTGKANLGVLKDVTQQMVDSGSPLLNRPLRWIYQNVGGDPSIIKFKVAHAAVVNEYAKILSGSLGSAGVTEGARHEAESMIPLDATPAQIAAAAGVLETDAGNRLSALTQGVQSTRARTSGKPAAAAQPGGAAPAVPAEVAKPVRAFKRVNGKLVEVTGQ
jgi:hypothetical protein